MRQLTTIESVVLLCGAVLMVVGAGLYVFCPMAAAPVVFVVGAVAFAVMQFRQTYDGDNLAVRRLRRIMCCADVMFLLSALLMVENTFHWLFPLFLKLSNGYTLYMQCIHNNWVLALLVAAVLQLYSTHRIGKELKK